MNHMNEISLYFKLSLLLLQDPGSLDEGTDGPLGRARASSDGCLFESSRFDEDVTQEAHTFHGGWFS